MSCEDHQTETDFMLRKAKKFADRLHRRGFQNHTAQAYEDLELFELIEYLVDRVKQAEEKLGVTP